MPDSTFLLKCPLDAWLHFSPPVCSPAPSARAPAPLFGPPADGFHTHARARDIFIYPHACVGFSHTCPHTLMPDSTFAPNVHIFTFCQLLAQPPKCPLFGRPPLKNILLCFRLTPLLPQMPTFHILAGPLLKKNGWLLAHFAPFSHFVPICTLP